MRIVTKGATGVSLDLFIPDSASTAGAGKTGLAYSSAGLTAHYRRGTTGTPTAITLAALANAQAAWTSGGFVEVDATAMPGVYRLDVPDAALAAGVDRVHLFLKGASGMAPVPIGIVLTAMDLQDGTAGGLSRLDAAVSSRSTYAGTDTSGTTTLLTRLPSALTITGGKVDLNDKTGFSLSQAFPANFASLAITGGGAVTAGTISDKTGYSLASAPPTSAAIAAAVWDLATTGHTTSGTFGASVIAAGSAGDPWSTSLPGSYGAGTAGYIVGNRLDAAVSSRLAASSYAALIAGINDIKLKTDNLPNSPAAVSDIPSASVNAAAVWGAVTRTLTAESDSAGVTTLLARVTGPVLLASSAPANFGALAISAAGIVQSDVAKVAGYTITGSGTSGDPWGPAP